MSSRRLNISSLCSRPLKSPRLLAIVRYQLHHRLTDPHQQSQVLLLAGEITGFRNDTDRELVFRQESNFNYLTGCTIPGSFVLAAYQHGTKPSVELFIPKANQDDMMWSIPPPDPSVVSQTHDVTRVDHPDALPNAITSLLTRLPGALFHTLPRGSPLFPSLPEEYTAPIVALQNDEGAVTDAYLLSALQRARLTKDAFEIAEIAHANEISSRAHEVVMRVLGLAVRTAKLSIPAGRPLLPGEWLIEKEGEAEAIFVASCRREGYVRRYFWLSSSINQGFSSLAPSIKPISPSSPRPHALQRYTIAVTIVNSLGDP